MSERTDFERELVRRLADAARSAEPGAVERARLAIVNVPQRRGLSRWTSATLMMPWVQVAATVGVIVAAVLVGYALGRLGPRPGDGRTATPTPSLLPTQSAAALPALDMPGTRSSPAGKYGWTGSRGFRTGMHNVVSVGDGYRMTQMVFAVDDNCFARGSGPERGAVTVAGLDGRSVEPYVGPGTLFMPNREKGETTRAYALPIGDRTLCVYLTWDATTTTKELDAARRVVDSILGQPFGAHGVRIVFTLPEGWDTG